MAPSNRSETDSWPAVARGDDALITAEIEARPSRPPDYEAESRVLSALAGEMADNPRGVLQRLAELVVEVCHADSASVSILEPGGAHGSLRWQAAAGAFAANLDATVPCDASPHGTLIAGNAVLLFDEPERIFPALRGAEPRIYESLLAPWQANGETAGALWAIKHTPQGRFDAEDARLLQSLARFASAAYQMSTALDAATTRSDELERPVAERTVDLRESEAHLAVNLAGMRRLYDLHARLANESDLAVALGEIVAAANAFLGTNRGCIQLVSDDGERLEMFAYRGYDEQDRFIQHFLHEGSRPACDAARRDRWRLVIEDVATFPGLRGATDREVALADGIRATQSTPMIGRAGELVGVLSNQFPRPHRPSDDELRLIDLLAWMATDFVERYQANTALRESEERYRALATASADVIYRMGPDWSEMRQLDGRGFLSDSAEPTDSWLERYIPPDDRARVTAAIEEAVRTGSIFALEHRVVRVDGTIGWVISRAVPMIDDLGKIVEWIGAASDVTARKAAEAALRQSEERKAFLLHLSDALRPLRDPGEIQAASARLLGEHLGVNQAHYGETVGDHVHIHQGYGHGLPAMIGRFRFIDFGEQLVASYRAGKTAASDDVAVDPTISPAECEVLGGAGIRAYVAVPLVKDGEWVATLAVHNRTPRRWQPKEIALVEEVAELTWAAAARARAENALRESEASLQQRVTTATSELRAVSRRLLTVQEEERRFLARELHDEIGQVLTGLNFQLAAAAGKTEKAALAEAQATVQDLTEQVRQLSMDLRPAVLDRYGLLAAMEWYAERYQKRTGISVDLRHAGLERRLPPDVEIGAYRVVQEALTNIARHARADAAAIQLFADDGMLTVVVRDQGAGFDSANAPTTSGLGGMRERVALLGGTLEIESAPGRGTTITAEFPHDGDEEAAGDRHFAPGTKR